MPLEEILSRIDHLDKETELQVVLGLKALAKFSTHERNVETFIKVVKENKEANIEWQEKFAKTMSGNISPMVIYFPH